MNGACWVYFTCNANRVFTNIIVYVDEIITVSLCANDIEEISRSLS